MCMDINNTITSNTAPTTKEVLVNATVQDKICDIVSTRLTSGHRVTITNLSKEMNISVHEIRTALSERYGDRVQFKRGRTGGITIT